MKILLIILFSVFINADTNSTLIDSQNLGLTVEDWNFQIALLANFVGLTMFFLICFLSLLIARK